MNLVKSIVVGLDFSPASRAALAQAVRIARGNDGTLHVVHVIESRVVADLADAIGDSTEAITANVTIHAQETLDTGLAEEPEAAALVAPATTRIAIGAPFDEILAEIETWDADALVIGAYGASGAGRGAGTLAVRFVRHAPCKVLLVDERNAEPFRTVVAAVDFAKSPTEVVEQAVRIATRERSKLRLLHVYFGPWNRLHYRAPTPEASPDFQTQYKAGLQNQLEDILAGVEGDVSGLDVKCELVECSSAGHGIITYARDVDADLVMVGMRPHTKLHYFLHGSTVERMLRELACSVVTIRPDAEAGD